MPVLRTPEDRFQNLDGFPYQAHYTEIHDPDHGPLRMHHVDEGPSDGPVVLCLHGEPTWSYLYRKMIPVFVEHGCRVVAPDLIGFGRSDKLSERTDYNYLRHVEWMTEWLSAQSLGPVTLVGQDWGGLIGLRLLAEHPEWFSRVSLSNTFLPTGDHELGEDFKRWRDFSQNDSDFDAGFIVNLFGHGHLSEAEQKAYRAPFPSEEYKAGARQFPVLVPARPDDPASDANRKAWKVLGELERPMLLCFSDKDLIMRNQTQYLLDNIAGTAGQPHITLHGRHFIQEEDGPRWAEAVARWIHSA